MLEVPEDAMHRFTDAARKAVADQNWFAALFVSLALPDICGSLENPAAKVGERYVNWFNRYLAPRYGKMFSADDCYYFRCACLHQGLGTHEKSRNDGIHFIPPPPRGNVVHLNLLNNVLQMQIDMFYLDMSDAVEKWTVDVAGNADIQKRIGQLIQVHPLSSLRPFIAFD